MSGLVVEYIVAIDVARVRFPADASRGGSVRPSASVEVYQACRIPMSRGSIRSQSVSEAHLCAHRACRWPGSMYRRARCFGAVTCIGGLVVEYIVAIGVTRVRFPADAPGGPADSRPGHVKEVGPLHRRRGCRACTHV